MLWQQLLKIHLLVQAVEHLQTSRPQNLKSVAMATVVARYTKNLASSRSSGDKHILKFFFFFFIDIFDILHYIYKHVYTEHENHKDNNKKDTDRDIFTKRKAQTCL